jgi:hypothetical protein
VPAYQDRTTQRSLFRHFNYQPREQQFGSYALQFVSALLREFDEGFIA